MTTNSRPSDLVKDVFPDAESAGTAGRGAPEYGDAGRGAPEYGDAGRGAPEARLEAAPIDVATLDDIEEAMREVVDPELMVNVVDLGLVYGIHVDEGNNATLDMTLTSPTCPLTDMIEYETQAALSGLVNSVAINWVWLPPWTLDNITDDGREQLRAIGYNL